MNDAIITGIGILFGGGIIWKLFEIGIIAGRMSEKITNIEKRLDHLPCRKCPDLSNNERD